MPELFLDHPNVFSRLPKVQSFIWGRQYVASRAALTPNPSIEENHKRLRLLRFPHVSRQASHIAATPQIAFSRCAATTYLLPMRLWLSAAWHFASAPLDGAHLSCSN